MRSTFFGLAAHPAACWKVWMWAAQGALVPPRTLSLFPLADSLPGALSRNLNLDFIMNWGVWNQHTVESLSQRFFDVGFTICLPDRTPCGCGVRTKYDLSKCLFLDQKLHVYLNSTLECCYLHCMSLVLALKEVDQWSHGTQPELYKYVVKTLTDSFWGSWVFLCYILME